MFEGVVSRKKGTKGTKKIGLDVSELEGQAQPNLFVPFVLFVPFRGYRFACLR
jgi:hypothetical protein